MIDGMLGAFIYMLAAIFLAIPGMLRAEMDKRTVLMYTYKMESSAIEKIEYNPESLRLSVYFTNNPTRYNFDNVPAVLVEQFRTAESAGKFYNSEIRNKYQEIQ